MIDSVVHRICLFSLSYDHSTFHGNCEAGNEPGTLLCSITCKSCWRDNATKTVQNLKKYFQKDFWFISVSKRTVREYRKVLVRWRRLLSHQYIESWTKWSVWISIRKWNLSNSCHGLLAMLWWSVYLLELFFTTISLNLLHLCYSGIFEYRKLYTMIRLL